MNEHKSEEVETVEGPLDAVTEQNGGEGIKGAEEW